MRKFMLITNRYKDRDLTLSNEIVSYIQQKGGSAAICVSNVEHDNQKDFALSEIPADSLQTATLTLPSAPNAKTVKVFSFNDLSSFEPLSNSSVFLING